MDVATLTMDPVEAQVQLDRYCGSLKSRRHNEEREVANRIAAEDRATEEMLKVLAEGKPILDLVESMRLAGVNEQGLPRLAIARADQERCWCHHSGNRYVFGPQHWNETIKRLVGMIPADALPSCKVGTAQFWKARAVVPTIPPQFRPATALRHFHILWEAEWQRVPEDPLLLRWIRGHQYAVLAQWDLTEIERMVLSARFNS
ncbi:hypothetical protein GC163_19760 [bacterium]|nr:hypothetical protein [bacterium]